jgi:hypothetical protein
MSEHSSGMGMIFVPNRIIKNLDHTNIFSVLPIVQAHTGMRLFKGFKTFFNIYDHAY